MFGVVPKSMWQRLNPPDANNMCTWAMRCLLVETAGRRILIDTGMGDKQDTKFRSHFEPHGEETLLGSLAKLGLTPEDITDVLLTHLHFDHCGGAVTRTEAGDLVPTFPNAIYWTSQEHWKTATEPNPRERASFLKENILPLAEQNLLQFATDGQELYPGLSVKFVYGHTEAMMLPHINYKGRTLIYMADLIPSTGHIKLPYIMAYDMQPLCTLAEKETYLTYAYKNDCILFFEHDPKIECATLKKVGSRILLGETFKLEKV